MVARRQLTVDFTGTSAQRDNGLNNALSPRRISMVHYAVKVRLRARPAAERGLQPAGARSSCPRARSLLNPQAPGRRLRAPPDAAGAGRCGAEGAGAAGAERRPPAGCHVAFPTFAAGGFDDRPRVLARDGGEPGYFVISDIIGGGMGGHADGDGIDAVDTHGGNCALLSAEVLETTRPVPRA